MRVLCVFVVLFLLSSQVQAQPPVKQYEMGFETVEVFEYIKSLRETNQPIPIFPTRTSNALIVRAVADKSRASMAGLQENDLIHIVNGSHLRAPRAGDKKLSRITSQDELKLGVIRREEN
jgi:type II secretory pathway component PulC